MNREPQESSSLSCQQVLVVVVGALECNFLFSARKPRLPSHALLLLPLLNFSHDSREKETSSCWLTPTTELPLMKSQTSMFTYLTPSWLMVEQTALCQALSSRRSSALVSMEK